VNIIFSLILSQGSFGVLETIQFTETLGNITLLESMLLFIYGLIGAYSNTERLRWYNKDDVNSVNVRTRTGIWAFPTKRRMEVVDEGDLDKEWRYFTSILCGVIFLIETVALVLLTR
jgi:hypothetical protein